MKENFFTKMFTAHSGLSSKRVCGFVGWVICLFLVSYCAITEKQTPALSDTIVIAAVALLGVDSVTSIWKKKDT